MMVTRRLRPSELRAVLALRRFCFAPFGPCAVWALRRLGPALLLLLSPFAVSVSAQTPAWNSPRTLDLVRNAINRRITQLADTGLIEYQATAHGYLTFLAQLGTGFPTPPKIVKTDQLALHVYWRSPDYSKQLIIGRRDTTLLPTDINYHRDHLGIVQNNFANIIRLGEGDEVHDVPHPLSPAGMVLYDFQISDSLRISIPGQTFDVYEVKVRPKDDTKPRVVGALYIDRQSGQVVRMALSFTRAALIDPQLEDISIVLENGLIGSRFWLPRHQEIEIRRTGTWFDYPVRGIIRGRWEVSDYQLNVKLPMAFYAGPEFVQEPPSVLKAYPWHGDILDSLPPDVAVTTDADVRRVQDEARALVREQALRRAETTRLAARGLSDFVSVNRVQGLAIGAGVEQGVAHGFSVGVRPQYGINDHLLRGTASLNWKNATGTTVSFSAGRVLADARDEPERSGIVNSLAAQEFGSDATEPYDLKSVGLRVTTPSVGLRWTFGASLENQSRVTVHAQPAQGTFAPTISAARYNPLHFSLGAERAAPVSWAGIDVTALARLDWYRYAPSYVCPSLVACTFPATSVRRAFVMVDAQRDLGNWQLISHTHAAIVHGVGGDVPTQFLAYVGGPVTAPGYPLHMLNGTRGISQRVELRIPVPFYGVPIGTFGRAPARATLAPFFDVVAVNPPVEWAGPAGAQYRQHSFPSVGLGLITFFDMVRVDVARGLAHDGRWTFSLDFAREFWGIL